MTAQIGHQHAVARIGRELATAGGEAVAEHDRLAIGRAGLRVRRVVPSGAR